MTGLRWKVGQRGLWLPPSTVDGVGSVPDRADADAAVDTDAGFAADGYTKRVRQLEAQAAEADRIRDLPTKRVLDRQQELTEEETLRRLDTVAHARRLAAGGEREREQLAAKAASAAAKRGLEANADVQALRLAKKGQRRSLMAWAVLLLAAAFTTVGVQRFAAAGAEAWSAQWLVAWGVDPLLTVLVVWLLLARGDLAAVGSPMSATTGRSKFVVLAVELGALGAALLMNVAPELTRPQGARWELVALHVVIPLAGIAAALALPIVQGYYSAAITAVYTAHPRWASGAVNLPEHATAGDGYAGWSDEDWTVLADVRTAIGRGELKPAPTGYAIYRKIMGGKGDKGRAYRVAAALAAAALPVSDTQPSAASTVDNLAGVA